MAVHVPVATACLFQASTAKWKEAEEKTEAGKSETKIVKSKQKQCNPRVRHAGNVVLKVPQ